MTTEDAFGVILWSTDVFALASFLEQVAGLDPGERHPGFASLRAGTCTIMVHADESYRGHPWYRALAVEGVARGIGAELRFRVADAEVAFSTALRLGGISVTPPYLDGDSHECQVMGPDSYLISLWSR
ncbi:MAG: hypothetical protein LC118_10755 [Dehalococcoidia bacterium]|nr:hypothetical protein [Dehalococcoidia bacterium]